MARSVNGFALRSFRGPTGCTEHYVTVEAPGDFSLSRQIDCVAQRYAEALQSLSLPPESAIFRRIYLSDIANQAALLRQSSLFQEPLESPVAISMVQQAPLPDSKVALLAYHLESPAPIGKQSLSPDHMLVELGGLSHLWSTRLCATNTEQPGSTAEQTREVFNRQPEQVSYLNDFDRLCATKDYDVTFERGTRIAYADRGHHLISGTASIDPSGEVMHRGNVHRQLERTLENVDALLRSGGARIEDMTHFLVYLRDSSDYAVVQSYLAERFPQIPQLILRGAVCRPEWLVEVEGIAIAAHDAPALPQF